LTPRNLKVPISKRGICHFQLQQKPVCIAARDLAVHTGCNHSKRGSRFAAAFNVERHQKLDLRLRDLKSELVALPSLLRCG
jgi:hypothetical protein